MRFRVKDLLLATSLLSIYLAVFMYFLNATGGMPGMSKSETLAYTSVLVCSSLCTAIFYRRRSVKKAEPIVCKLHTFFPWANLIFNYALVLTIILLMLLFDTGVRFIIFLAISFSLMDYVLHPFLLNQVPVSRRGIVYQFSLIPWNKVYVDRDSSGVIHKIRTSKYWWSPLILVPEESAEIINELFDHNSETLT